jgi:hypothetical protein
MHTARLFAFMLLLTFPLAGGPLDDLQANFQTRCDFAEADRDLQLKKLDASYLAALDRQVEKTKASGKLDAVIPLIEEIQAVKAGTDPLPELPEAASLELKQMRGKHAEARAKILKSHAEAITSLADKMETALKTKEQELTKAGKFDDALAAQKMRENLASDEDLARARDQLTASKPAIKTGEWRSLLAEPMEITKKGVWDVGILANIEQESKGLEPFVKELRSLPDKPNAILLSIPPAITEFKLTRQVREAKGTIMLGNANGSIHFKIYAGEKMVFEKIIQGEVLTHRFEVEFEPTKQIRLEVDPMGNPAFDWGAWVAPEIR